MPLPRKSITLPIPCPDARALRVVAVAGLVACLTSAPVLAEPDTGTDQAAGCWPAGEAPALFSWSASPGIACRDRGPAEAAVTAGAVAPTGTSAAKDAPQTKVTFSGTAYFGIAASF